MTNQTNIKVCVRCRPFIANELVDMQNKEPPFYINENSIELKNQDPTLTKSMNFDYVFDELSNTNEIYDKLLSEMIPTVCDGYNVTTFAYGQTASGKTFTMKGTHDKPGLIRLAIRDVFNQIKNSEGENRTFLIRVSYLEIYNEKVRDLLSPDQRYVNIFVDKNKNLSFDHLTEEIVRSEQETMDIISRGTSHIMVAKTVANDASSRSHTIFRMIVERKDEISVDNSQPSLQSSLTKKAKSKQIIRIGNLNLVDLAGSENSSEQADFNRKREGQNINLSLLHLKEIITKLSNGEKVTSFRNSKLTRILGDSLGGNARVAVVCAISPDPVKLKETKRTLEFGSNAQKISIKPTVNSECDNALIMKYQTELETLQSELSMLKEKLQNQKTQTEKEETEEEVKELERIMSDLTDSMVTNKSLEARLVNVEKEKRDHEERIRQMEEERAKLEELLKIEEERKRIQEEESKSKEETLYLLQQETASMSLQLEEIISSKNNIESESKRRELQIQDLMNYNQILEQKTLNEENSRRRAEDMISEQNKQIEHFKQINEHYEREYKKEKIAKEEASKMVQQKLEEMQNIQQQLSMSRTEKENYEMQIKTLNDNMNTMYNMWKEDFDKEISVREKEKNQLDEQIARLTSLLEEKDLQIKRLQENCKTQDYLQHFVDTLERDVKSYKQRLEVSEIELSSTKKKSLETFRENIELKKKVSSLENELEALKLHFIVNFGQESLPKSPKPSHSNSSNFFESNNITSIPAASLSNYNNNGSNGSISSNMNTSITSNRFIGKSPPSFNSSTVTPNTSVNGSNQHSKPSLYSSTNSSVLVPSSSSSIGGGNSLQRSGTSATNSPINLTTNTHQQPMQGSLPQQQQRSTSNSVGSTITPPPFIPFMNTTPPMRPSTPINTTTNVTPQKSPSFTNSISPLQSNQSTLNKNTYYSTPPPLSNSFSPIRPSTPTSLTTPPQCGQQEQFNTSLSQQLSSNYSTTVHQPSRPLSNNYSPNPFNNSIGGMSDESKGYSNPYDFYPSSNTFIPTQNTSSQFNSNTNPTYQTSNNFNNQRSQYPTPNKLSINTQNIQPVTNQRGLDSPTLVNIPPTNNSNRPQSTGTFQPRQTPIMNNRVSLPQQTPLNSSNQTFSQPTPVSNIQPVNQSALVRNRPKNFNSVPSTTGNLYPSLPTNTNSGASFNTTNSTTANSTTTTNSTSTTMGNSNFPLNTNVNSRPSSPSVYRVTGEKAFKAKEERELNEEPEGPIVGINEKSFARPKRSLSISKLIGLVRGDDKKVLK